ncbi:TBC1 domain family member 19 [Hondaea fermentalgiana]|uniref:TBC1 domain family member 19 n=1 Tax=Hondaea fermentalgiana TaxID=2315210 RepID=A0A2R5G2F0_9STRA|nr:TBC1 domain family member 19 [Hondaea fermentalgiana]|eukprot:GBG25172.1 TBC1 domain family member 19 [Hondaea fermentalgiana]
MQSLARFEEAQQLWDENLRQQLLSSRGDRDTRVLYNSRDLLYSLESLCKSLDRSDSGWSLCPMGLRTCSVRELRETFAELGLDRRQIGVEDTSDPFVEAHTTLGNKLMKLSSVQLVEQYMRQGCPASLRPAIYRAVLFPSRAKASTRRRVTRPTFNDGSSVPGRARERVSRRPETTASDEESSLDDSSDEEETAECSGASTRPARDSDAAAACAQALARLHALDVELIRNNDNYFVFEDLLRDVVPSIFREHLTWLRAHARVAPRDTRALPIVPYRGLALQAAPLAFVYKDQSEIVLCVREMYARYWCQLNTIRNTPAGAIGLSLLPNLCAQFESLIQERCSDVLQHMLAFDIHPLEVAFPWLHLAFANALPVEQLLLLWDRIIGFDSLILLPVLAAAIFDYRRPVLLAARSTKHVRALLGEMANLNVIALLQAFLFAPT